MPKRRLRFTAPDALVEEGLAAVRSQWDIPEGFPPEVLEEADAVEPELPKEDLTDVPFVTIDPPGARDLDQALHIERQPGGYRVHYAIADAGGFIPPNGAMDVEARTRGVTMYGPDRRTPLYPPIISEGHASLLPDETRSALVWTLELDADAELGEIDVRRALMRSRDQLDYAAVQMSLDADTAPESLQLLAEVGRLRQLIEEARGAVSLAVPEQQVVRRDGGWELEYRTPLPIEGWNAQISLLTGMAAAHLMMSARVGILRTLPPARPGELRWLRRVAKGLQVRWPEPVAYPDFIRSLDARIPTHAALLAESTTLFSGAGYQVLGPNVDAFEHSALAVHYAHATAPLRRLVDRFVGATCLAISGGDEVPDWVTGALPSLPAIMARADSIAGSYEAACLNLVEAAVLSNRIGQTFDGVVVEVDREHPHGDIQLRHPAVHARVEDASLDLGEEIGVRLVDVSITERRVVFERA